eukprot:m.53721 g.53721  ORF g.53721 m.53721 type:complete len:775 (-) comp10880_c0_seq1:2129-4453(-)
MLRSIQKSCTYGCLRPYIYMRQSNPLVKLHDSSAIAFRKTTSTHPTPLFSRFLFGNRFFLRRNFRNNTNYGNRGKKRIEGENNEKGHDAHGQWIRIEIDINGKRHDFGSGGNRGGGGGGDGPMYFWIGTSLVLLYVLMTSSSDSSSTSTSASNPRGGPPIVRPTSMQHFIASMLQKGIVRAVDVDTMQDTVIVHLQPEAKIDGEAQDNVLYRFSVSSAGAFEERLEEVQRDMGVAEEDFVQVTYRIPPTGWEILTSPGLLFMLGLMGATALAVRSGVRQMRRQLMETAKKQGMPPPPPPPNSPFSFGRMKVNNITPEVASTKFSDVAGLGEAKEEIKEFVEFLHSPEKFQELGAKIPKGAILVGPPGTGKTLLAKAVAGEAQVPIFAVAGSDFVEMFVGVGASRVRDLFQQARQSAPSIVYIDEIDAIGKARGGDSQFNKGSQERESTLNQLLVEMDGFGNSEDGKEVVILASTNRVDTLDRALLRPGRFDRKISCDLPSTEERKQIFMVHMLPLKFADNFDQSEIVNQLASMTTGLSGAQIASICNEAALHAVREGMESVNAKDFNYAIDRVLSGPAKANSVLNAYEKRILAFHHAGHVVSSWFLEHGGTLLKTSIIPRAGGKLGFDQYMPSELYLHTKEELEDRMVVMLSGRASEMVMFGSVTTDGEDDLNKVTDLGYKMMTRFGMSEKLGSLAWDDFPQPKDGYRKTSDALATTVEREVNALVTKAFNRAVALLQQHKHELEVLGEKLLVEETLSAKDVESLIGPRPFQER